MWPLLLITSHTTKIIKATLAMGVPPVLIAAWIREYRNSETQVKLDGIVDRAIRRTRSVPQGAPSAADLFGAALDTPAAKFCDMCRPQKKGAACGKRVFWSFALRGQLLDLRDVTRRAPNIWQVRGMNC